jgi:hypothetical protein
MAYIISWLASDSRGAILGQQVRAYSGHCDSFFLGPKSASVKEKARDGNLSSFFQRRDPIADILALNLGPLLTAP